LFFFFKKINVYGTNNIPKKGAVLFVSNHKNALIDPILIATTTTRNIHFLTRASAFKLKLVKWLLSTVNMLPIYRLRDGKETLAKNSEIFNKCYSLLGKKRSLLIFPEGTHDIKRWVRPLSKGFTRITFGALENNPGLELKIVPIGLNYNKADKFAESVTIFYGDPIHVNPYWNKDDMNTSTAALKKIVSDKMKELTTHIEDQENYDTIIQKLGSVDFLKPKEVNNLIRKINTNKSQITNNKIQKSYKSREPSFLWKGLKSIVNLNSIIPLIIYKAIEPKIQEIEFVSTTKFAIGITAFPIFYILQTLVINYFFGIQIALLYLVLSIILILLLAKSKTYN
jgi:1-acyl-sn-glycerol-3-phosphate acyltransferase